jgi:hypothetical protein
VLALLWWCCTRLRRRRHGHSAVVVVVRPWSLQACVVVLAACSCAQGLVLVVRLVEGCRKGNEGEVGSGGENTELRGATTSTNSRARRESSAGQRRES